MLYETCRGPCFAEGSYDNQGFSSFKEAQKAIGVSKSTPLVVLNDFEQGILDYWKSPRVALGVGLALHYKVGNEMVHLRRCMHCRGKAVLYSSPWD
jgi:hypothetical protein